MIHKIIRKAAEINALDPAMRIEALRGALGAEKGIVAESIVRMDDCLLMMVDLKKEPFLLIMSEDQDAMDGFFGEQINDRSGDRVLYAMLCAANHGNAVFMRQALPYTGPSVLECSESFGTGDRIGGRVSATPGHIAALRGTGMTPVLAQQSVRENQKTGRTFDQVIDDVTWAVFRTGFTEPWGADADHLKTIAQVEEAARAGFTFFTIDPSDLIDDNADSYGEDELDARFRQLFQGGDDAETFISLHEGALDARRTAIVRCAVKYLPAIRHAITAHQRLVEIRGEGNFNFELSIDETATTTSPLDHHIIVSELLREGVRLFSLAPRFEGAFEKGIDYKGTPEGFRRSLTTHVQLARELGDYRLSLHSGSDKFSIYPIFGEVTDGFFHIKTAGTSYLEAVKVVASRDLALFRRILRLSLDTFVKNAASYEISADPANVPAPESLDIGSAVREIAENNDMRQVLHIAFGVVLDRYGDRLRAALRDNADVYSEYLVKHIGRHVDALRRR